MARPKKADAPIASEVLESIAARVGWTDSGKLALVCGFITAQGKTGDLKRFLEQMAAYERQES